MALVVFLRGVNVGGHKTFRPSVLARQLSEFGVVNVGAAGTFVVRRPVTQAKVRAEFARRLPFTTEIIICSGSAVLQLAESDPLGGELSRPHIVPFVSVLARYRPPSAALPRHFPETGEWGLKILGQQGRFVFGVYRRQMKAISYLAQLDRLYGVPVTTRHWNTVAAITRLLHAPSRPP